MGTMNYREPAAANGHDLNDSDDDDASYAEASSRVDDSEYTNGRNSDSDDDEKHDDWFDPSELAVSCASACLHAPRTEEEIYRI
jgi:hypothetical protein